jgi:hypothetical protein
MSTPNTPTATPTTSPTARDMVEQARAAGISPEDLIAAARESMCTITPMTATTHTRVEQAATPLIGFSDMARHLKVEANFDLEKAREQAVKDHTQWGIVEALQKQGLIKDADAYGRLFDKATMSEAGLNQLVAQLKEGKLQLPLFDANLLSDADLFRILIEEAGIPFRNDTYGYKNLGNVRIIDPSHIPNLANLNRATPWQTHLAAFKAAYDQAQPWEPGTPRLIATLDVNEVSETNISATESAQNALNNGTTFATLGPDLLRFRLQLDRGVAVMTQQNPREMNHDGYRKALQKGLEKPFMGSAPFDAHMPDRQKITQYPLEVLPNGNVLDFDWNPDYRRVCVCNCYPGDAVGDVGRRSVLK